MWQCRYSGVEVPDHLWKYHEFGNGKAYADNQAEDIDNKTHAVFDEWVNNFINFVQDKGKVQPGKYRAFDKNRPGHFFADLKLKWRAIRVLLGFPRKNSSPANQQKLNLNHDNGWNAKKSEREKLNHDK